MSPAREVVAALSGEDVARALFLDNPRAVLDNRPLPYQPTPAAPKLRGRKRFWFF